MGKVIEIGNTTIEKFDGGTSILRSGFSKMALVPFGDKGNLVEIRLRDIDDSATDGMGAADGIFEIEAIKRALRLLPKKPA